MIENEVKVLNVNVAELSRRLEEIGFRASTVRSFRRVVFETRPPDGSKWVRLRTDGSQTTLTYKHFKQDSIDGVEEVEVAVDDFDKCRTLLGLSGFRMMSYQENRRLEFASDVHRAAVSIDYWPKIPPYLEIEADTVESVRELLVALDIDVTATTSVTTQEVYKQYGIDISGAREIRFPATA